MVVNDFDIHWVLFAIGPFETNAVLIINANAVLALTITAQRLQPVFSHSAEGVKTHRCLKLVKLGLSLESETGECLDELTIGETLRVSVAIFGWHLHS